MRSTDSGTTDLRRSAYETACRDFWLAHVMIEAGRAPKANWHYGEGDRHAEQRLRPRGALGIQPRSPS